MPVGADFLDLPCSSGWEDHMANRRKSQLLTTKEAAEFFAPQAAHPRKHALGRQRPDLHEARRSRLLPSRRPQDVAQGIAPAILSGREAVKVRPLLGMTIAVALIVAP